MLRKERLESVRPVHDLPIHGKPLYIIVHKIYLTTVSICLPLFAYLITTRLLRIHTVHLLCDRPSMA